MRTPACFVALLLLCAPALASSIEGRATVIDGDTIQVEGTTERIRLYGIDAPESGQTCETKEGARYLCGSKSAEHLVSLIGRNGRVSCVEEDRDRYGRIVADCRVGSVSLNGAMVSAGWAIQYDAYSDGRFTDQQKAGEGA